MVIFHSVDESLGEEYKRWGYIAGKGSRSECTRPKPNSNHNEDKKANWLRALGIVSSWLSACIYPEVSTSVPIEGR